MNRLEHITDERNQGIVQYQKDERMIGGREEVEKERGSGRQRNGRRKRECGSYSVR